MIEVAVGGPGRGDLPHVPVQGRQESLLITDAAPLLEAEVLDQGERAIPASTGLLPLPTRGFDDQSERLENRRPLLCISTAEV